MREFWKFATLAHGAAGGQVSSERPGFSGVGGKREGGSGVTQVARVHFGP